MKKQLIEFHKVFNLYLQKNPSIKMPKDIIELRHKLLEEEVGELKEAMDEKDIAHIAKELADVLYVTYGTIIGYGLQDKMIEIFDEVHRSNMSKLDANGKPIIRDDGKILKSNNYAEADLSNLI